MYTNDDEKTIVLATKLNSIISKHKNNAIDKIDVSIDEEYKLLAVAGLIDEKHNNLASKMTKEELKDAYNALCQTILPADILVNDTIPVKDASIYHANESAPDVDSRFLIFDKEDWFTVGEANEESIKHNTIVTIVGVIITISSQSNGNDRCVIPIITIESDSIQPQLALELHNAYKMEGGSILTRRHSSFTDFTLVLLGKLMTRLLGLWYATQVTLLNPLINYRTVQHQIHITSKTRKGKKKSGAPKIKYYKTIYVESEVLDQFFEDQKNERGEINRHCLMWYVTGHWRHYANGKKVFIQGYWKGEGRFSGIEAETRQRELVLDEDDLPKEKVPKPKEPTKRLFVDSSYDEHVHCECGQLFGSDHLAKRCEKCNTLVMYRN